jgi:ornithine decarboxylase
MLKTLARSLIAKHSLKDSFYLYDMECLRSNVQRWMINLPRVHPFYAIKCNPDEKIIETLAEMNVGFDCASKKEMAQALTFANPMTIIFAHPCKRDNDITFAHENNISLTTFDTLSEIKKLSRVDIPCLLRIKIDNPSAKVQLGLKYGAEVNMECEDILKHARDAGLDVRGVSFHVGSASKDPRVFETAIQNSAVVFDMMRSVGYSPSVLNIGGGFVSSSFEESARVITKAIDEYIKDPNIEVMAEPGRFFVENIATFFSPIIGTRVRRQIAEYWIADSLYGSFNCILYDQQTPKIVLLDDYPADEKKYESIIWGSSCDSADRLDPYDQKVLIPKMEVGDWMMFPDFGAYTLAGATDFNGINLTQPKIFYL